MANIIKIPSNCKLSILDQISIISDPTTHKDLWTNEEKWKEQIDILLKASRQLVFISTPNVLIYERLARYYEIVVHEIIPIGYMGATKGAYTDQHIIFIKNPFNTQYWRDVPKQVKSNISIDEVQKHFDNIITRKYKTVIGVRKAINKKLQIIKGQSAGID